MTTFTEVTADQARTRLHEMTVIDVRTPGEYASGHLPGAYNIPLEHLDRALPVLKDIADHGDLLVVCASGARSGQACATLAKHGITATTLSGGTNGWAERGHDLHHPAVCEVPRRTWAMERQVRLTAGSLVLAGIVAGQFWPLARLLSAGIAGGLIFSAITNTCGMAKVLAKLPFNRPKPADLDATLAALKESLNKSRPATG